MADTPKEKFLVFTVQYSAGNVIQVLPVLVKIENLTFFVCCKSAKSPVICFQSIVSCNVRKPFFPHFLSY
jgi:hypothetical protein